MRRLLLLIILLLLTTILKRQAHQQSEHQLQKHSENPMVQIGMGSGPL